jgi:adenylate cyclase
MTSLIELTNTLHRTTKVLLVMDVVESVRLMVQDQDDFVMRWQKMVKQAEEQILPLHGGRIVKSLGDGLMLEFGTAQGAVNAAFALQQFSRIANLGLPPERHTHLRMGGHLASFVTDQHDIYGTDVNLTARFCTLAGPGEVVVSVELRDHLTADLDADIEDLGECHLKHLEKPVRAYRVGPAGHAPIVTPVREYAEPLQRTIAVIPFEARSNEPEHFAIGELIADGVISQLSRTAELRVISRLSSSVFRGRNTSANHIENTLGASYILSGSYVASSGKLLISAELISARTAEVVWAGRLHGDVGDLLQAESELSHQIASAAHDSIMKTEVQKSLGKPLPTLESSALLLSSISLMHRSTRSEFERSKEALEALIDRHNRAAAPRAWLAKWYVLRVVQGMSDSRDNDARRALDLTWRAMDIEPSNSLILAIQGYIHCQLSGNVSLSESKLNEAIQINPNESLAWLYKSVWSSMWGAPEASVKEAQIASDLSPIDPMRYYYDMILACGHSMNHDYPKAIELAQRSLKMNRHHQPTIRVLLHAQAQSGQIDEARVTLGRLLQENPDLTVANYLASGGTDSSSRQQVAAILRRLGVREN